MGVLRRAADGERAAGHPSRVRPHAEGPVLPLSRHARISRYAQGRLGYARTPGRDRGGEAARHQWQARDRADRGGRIQPGVPGERVDLSGRMGEAERADRLRSGLSRTVHHLHQRLHRERLVGAQDAARSQSAVPWPQDPSVLCALRDVAVEPRGGARVRGCEGSERVRCLETAGKGKWERGNERVGR